VLDFTCTVCTFILHPSSIVLHFSVLALSVFVHLYLLFPYLHFPYLHSRTWFFHTWLFHPPVLDFSVLAFSYAPKWWQVTVSQLQPALLFIHVQIPLALSGQRSHLQPNLRQVVNRKGQKLNCRRPDRRCGSPKSFRTFCRRLVCDCCSKPGCVQFLNKIEVIKFRHQTANKLSGI